jgi:hypothetical protein
LEPLDPLVTSMVTLASARTSRASLASKPDI